MTLAHETLLLVDAWEVAKEVEREAGKAIRQQKAKLLSLLGDAGSGILPDGRRLVRQRVERAGFTTEPTEYVQLRIKKARSS